LAVSLHISILVYIRSPGPLIQEEMYIALKIKTNISKILCFKIYKGKIECHQPKYMDRQKKMSVVIIDPTPP
jgi:hypothetical protein